MSAHYFRLTRCNAPLRHRSLLLERLLARADSCTAVTDWRADAFRVLAPPNTAMPGVAAAALFADQGAAQGASVLMATPVHYLAEMNNVRLPADGILSLQPAEAAALAGDFNRVWQDAGLRLLNGRGAALYCVADRPLEVTTHDPEEILDRHIENYLPAGADGPRLRRLLSEIEMWLFEHAVNRSRGAAAAPTVNGLWMWGGGAAVASLPSVSGWTAGHDAFFDAFSAGADCPRGAGSGVAVIAAEPGTAEWNEVESQWLEPSLADLRSGRIAHLELSAGDRRFNVGPRWSRRIWRGRRPWWEYLS